MNEFHERERKIIYLLRSLDPKDEVRIIKNGTNNYLVIRTQRILLDARFVDKSDSMV